MFNFLSRYISRKVFLIILPILALANLEKSKSSDYIIEGAFQRGLIVLASSSLTESLHDIIREFSKDKNIAISAAFKSSGELARDIEYGEPANVIISEDAKKMRDLQRQGVLNVFSLSTLASDQLALVLPKGHYLLNQIDEDDPIEKKIAKVINDSIPVIPDPSTDPAGAFIKEALETLKLWDTAKEKTIKTLNTRYALYLIAKGKNSGIIYLSDAKTDDSVEIIGIIPEKYHEKIIYQMAVVADIGSSESLKDSEEFVKYLNSEEAKKILSKNNLGKI
jgi:molybdate transport system substrate-binding protein